MYIIKVTNFANPAERYIGFDCPKSEMRIPLITSQMDKAYRFASQQEAKDFVDNIVKNPMVNFKNQPARMNLVLNEALSGWKSCRFTVCCLDPVVVYQTDYSLLRSFEEIDALMQNVNEEIREHWCNDFACACIGCVNRSSPIKGLITQEEWAMWMEHSEEKKQNKEFLTKEKCSMWTEYGTIP